MMSRQYGATGNTAVMLVRRPDCDYAQVPALWCAEYPEVAQALNVDSLSLPYLEPYLNAVIRRVQVELGRDHVLSSQIDWFCRQEGVHYREHRRYNAVLRSSGYPDLPKIELVLKQHFDRLLKERSLKFNCAYALAFETSDPVATAMWFDALGDILASAHPVMVTLWKWHLAEEYEHRSVIFDAYRELYADYPYRVYGLISFVRDWRKLSRDALAYLLEEDRKNMTPGEIDRSRQRLQFYRKRQSRFTMPRMLRVLLPFYEPRKLREPRGVSEFLRSIPCV